MDMMGPTTAQETTADLNQSAAPSVAVREDPLDAREQAHELIKELNAKRRAAGGEVPEAQAMMAEINRLLAQSDTANNAAIKQSMETGEPGDGDDYHAQARNLIAQVNNMYRQGHSTNSQQVKQLMQEVRRLQALGDAQRNRGTTAFPER
jgi:hypothetical protein